MYVAFLTIARRFVSGVLPPSYGETGLDSPAQPQSRSDAARTAGAAAGEGEGGGEMAETLLRDSVSSYQRALQMAEDNR